MCEQSVYDKDGFFARYQRLRSNPISLNEIIEKPTMLGLLGDIRQQRILDLGCGTGEHLRLYLQQGAKFVMGIDLSQAMLTQAQKNLAEYAPHFVLQQLSMSQLVSLKQQPFDIITSSFAFHYIEDFPALLKQIWQKLTDQGILVFSQEHPITTAHKQGERWQKNAQKEQIAYRLNHYREEGIRQRNWFQQPFNTYHRTLATIINNLIQTGFQIEQVEEPMLQQQPEWHTEFKDLKHRPPLLFIRARKV